MNKKLHFHMLCALVTIVSMYSNNVKLVFYVVGQIPVLSMNILMAPYSEKS